MALKLCPQAGKGIASPTRSASPRGGFLLEGVIPELGEFKRGRDIGKGASTSSFIWAACEDCGKERWVQYKVREARPDSSLCRSCNGRRKQRKLSSQNWKGGRRKGSQGYILVYLYPDDFFYPMVDKNHCVLEHRLVMAKHLGRCLQPWEIVHHKNHKRDDNRDENLALASDAGHRQITRLETVLEQQAKEIRLLKWQVSELTKQIGAGRLPVQKGV